MPGSLFSSRPAFSVVRHGQLTATPLSPDMVSDAKPETRLGSLGSVHHFIAQQPHPASPLTASSPQPHNVTDDQELWRLLAEALDDFDEPTQPTDVGSRVRGARDIESSASSPHRLIASSSLPSLRDGAHRLRGSVPQRQLLNYSWHVGSPRDGSRHDSSRPEGSQQLDCPHHVSSPIPHHRNSTAAYPTVRPTEQLMRATHPSVPAVPHSVNAVGRPPASRGAHESLAAVQASTHMAAPEVASVGRHSRRRPSAAGGQAEDTGPHSFVEGPVPSVRSREHAPMEQARGSSASGPPSTMRMRLDSSTSQPVASPAISAPLGGGSITSIWVQREVNRALIPADVQPQFALAGLQLSHSWRLQLQSARKLQACTRMWLRPRLQLSSSVLHGPRLSMVVDSMQPAPPSPSLGVDSPPAPPSPSPPHGSVISQHNSSQHDGRTQLGGLQTQLGSAQQLGDSQTTQLAGSQLGGAQLNGMQLNGSPHERAPLALALPSPSNLASPSPLAQATPSPQAAASPLLSAGLPLTPPLPSLGLGLPLASPLLSSDLPLAQPSPSLGLGSHAGCASHVGAPPAPPASSPPNRALIPAIVQAELAVAGLQLTQRWRLQLNSALHIQRRARSMLTRDQQQEGQGTHISGSLSLTAIGGSARLCMTGSDTRFCATHSDGAPQASPCAGLSHLVVSGASQPASQLAVSSPLGGGQHHIHPYKAGQLAAAQLATRWQKTAWLPAWLPTNTARWLAAR